MPFVPADLRIDARWIAPMTSRNSVLVDHSLVLRDGKILDILPTARAAELYAARAVLQRHSHLITPGFVNANCHAAASLPRGHDAPAESSDVGRAPESIRDAILLSVAQMLKAGVTCFVDRGFSPDQTANIAVEQGMRAVIGLPVAGAPSTWAKNPPEYLTRALRLRDEYRGHPLISSVFAPHLPNALDDEAFSRLATLADELDCGLILDVHRCAAEVDECLQRHGMRPIERLWKLGLLTPACNALHMSQVLPEDIGLAQRTGASITVCPLADVAARQPLPRVAEFAGAGIRMGIGSGAAANFRGDLWSDIRLIALMSDAWDALAMATRGGASITGLETEIGTLESGKWADLCCTNLYAPATHPVRDSVTQLVAGGARDLVSDVWVAGRQLVSDGELTRLDWPALAARSEG
jgi:5-methylthioadenosine/S-adenosylhomocysteine deaminase